MYLLDAKQMRLGTLVAVSGGIRVSSKLNADTLMEICTYTM